MGITVEDDTAAVVVGDRDGDREPSRDGVGMVRGDDEGRPLAPDPAGCHGGIVAPVDERREVAAGGELVRVGERGQDAREGVRASG